MRPVVVGARHVEGLREGGVGELDLVGVAAHIDGDLVAAFQVVADVTAAAVDAVGVVDGEVPVVVEAELEVARHEVGRDREDVGLLVPLHRDLLAPAADGRADDAQALDADHLEGVELLVEADHVDTGRDRDVVRHAHGTLGGDVDTVLSAHGHHAAEVAFPSRVRAELELGVAAVCGGEVDDALVVALDRGGELQGRGGGRIPALVAARGVEHLREGGHIGGDGHRGGRSSDALGHRFADRGHEEGHRHCGGFGAARGDDGLVEGVDRRGVAGLGETLGQQVVGSSLRLGGGGLLGDGAQVDVVGDLLTVDQARRLPGDQGHLGGRIGRVEDQRILHERDHGGHGVAERVDADRHPGGFVGLPVVGHEHAEGQGEGVIDRQGRETRVDQVLEARLGGLEVGILGGCDHGVRAVVGGDELVVQVRREVAVGAPGEVDILVHRVGRHQDVVVGIELRSHRFLGERVLRDRLDAGCGTGSQGRKECKSEEYLFHIRMLFIVFPSR